MEAQQSSIAGLAFRVDADGYTLLAEFTPGAHPLVVERDEIVKAVHQLGMVGCALHEPAMQKLAQQCGEATEPFTLAIGECHDAEIKITISDNKLAAYLTLSLPCGGQAASREQVLAALAQAGVVEGLLLPEIDVAVGLGEADHWLVAQGQPPVNGQDAQFRSLLPEIGDRSPRINEHGNVDYRELGTFITVKVGDPLMERTPATAGTPGKNVLGEVVLPKRGKDYTFVKGLKGAAASPKNYDLLVAEIAGQPIPVTRGVKVEPTLSVKGIDLSTGNLEFEGSVNIASDVKAGMKIKVAGDLIIGGTLEAAQIEAGGNITIRGGVIGSAEKDGEGNHRHGAASITSGGTVSALFVENARIEAGDSIVITEIAKQSELIAGNHIIIGREGSRKGHIVGGYAHASQLIRTVVAGSPAGLRTELKTGLNPQLQSSFYAAEIRLGKLQKELDEVQRALRFALENPKRVAPEILQKAEKTCEKLEQGIEACELEKDNLANQLELAEGAKVLVNKQLFGNVVIHIGHQARQIREDRDGGGLFQLIDGEIAFDTL